MTQPTEAVSGAANAPVDAVAEAEKTFNDIAETYGSEDEEENPVEEEGVEPEPEAEDEPEEEAVADDQPPIDAPVSWTAEEKERFKDLPREMQETLSRRESERERFVQSKAQEAARARSESEQAASQQLAQIERSYAQQYQAIAAQFEVPEPDPILMMTDQAAYVSQLTAHKAAQAQRLQAQQAAAYYADQARAREAQAAQAHAAQEYQIVAEKFPEYVDPATTAKHQSELASIALELGYPNELINEARAVDILAMRKAAEWKAKADKLDKLEAGKMEKVRAAKGKPPVVTPGVAVAQSQTRMKRADEAFSRAKNAVSTAEKGAAFGEYLTNVGII